MSLFRWSPLTDREWDSYHTPHAEAVERGWAPKPRRDPILDTPCDPHPVLSRLMHLALLKLMVIANGSTQAWGPDAALRGKSGGDSVMLLADAETYTIDQLAWDFEYGANTHRARLRVIREAQTMADRLQYAPKPSGPVRGSREWRMSLAKDPRPQRVVAADYRVSSKTITAARKEFAA